MAYVRGRLQRIADQLDDGKGEDPQRKTSPRIFERIKEHRRQFDDFALRVARNDISGANLLMQMTTRDYMRAAEAFLQDILSAKKASDRAAKRFAK